MKIKKLPHLQIGWHRRKIWHVAHHAPRTFDVIRDINSIEQDLAIGRLHQRREHTKSAGFSRTIGPHKTKHLACRYRQGKVIDRNKIAEIHAQRADIDGRWRGIHDLENR